MLSTLPRLGTKISYVGQSGELHANNFVDRAHRLEARRRLGRVRLLRSAATETFPSSVAGKKIALIKRGDDHVRRENAPRERSGAIAVAIFSAIQ